MKTPVCSGEIANYVGYLACIFLHERLTWREAVGMVIAAAGVLIVQIRIQRRRAPR